MGAFESAGSNDRETLRAALVVALTFAATDFGADIGEDTVVSGKLTGFADAALKVVESEVARHLAEAGAVHPAVHTPTRIVNYLERHSWERIESPTKPRGQVFWSPPAPNQVRWVGPRGIELDAPLCDDVPNYVDVVRVVVNRIAWAESGRIVAPDEALTAILLEIASMPDEVAW